MFWKLLKGQSNDTKTEGDQIESLLSRNVSELIDKETLRKMLKSGKPLRIKLGIDPTSPSIHIGRAGVLHKLRAFQDLGHKVVFIVGDFTAVIGDTSDKDSERPMLSEEKVQENMKSYFKQAGKIIDLSKAETHYNSKWLSKLTFKEISLMANAFGLSDFIARENIKKRLDNGSRVSLREVLYPLMQGYDSVYLKSDVEIGGVDQRFNLLAGRTLQEYYKQKPQQLLMLDLLLGTDGRKMSSSWGNTISLTDSAEDMFGKTMSVPDNLLKDYFYFATKLKEGEIEEIMKQHPKEAKMRLAYEITALYHGNKAAALSKERFNKVFSNKEIPEDVPSIISEEGDSLADVLVKNKIVSSKSEFARLVEAGAVELLPDNKVTDLKVAPVQGATYRVGKHRFVKIQ